MKKNRTLIFYITLIICFGSLMYLLSVKGEELQAGRIIKLPDGVDVANSSTAFDVFVESVLHNIVHPLAILILQITSIIIVARIFGFIFNKIGQPTVVGEIIAGVVLGPSVLGLFLPETSEFLFPIESLANLQFLSLIGLILFMFVIGMELDLKIIRVQARDALVISHGSIVIAYLLGMTLAFFMYEQYTPEHVSFLSFALFMGIAMSIAAFPVMARIIQERDLTKTRLGIIAITSAAIDDLTAWCLLAIVIAIVKAGSFVSAMFTIASAILYVSVMILIVHPFLKRIGDVYSDRETINKTIVALSFVVLLISAFIAEIIGIHALFGAFIAGVIMPPNFSFRRIMMEKVEDVSVVLLLPLFFVFTGLRTQIGLLNETHLWSLCGIIVLTAVVGKFGGSTLAARFVGQSWKNSFSLGALMNTRGLMELVVLNIGYDLGVLSPEVFAMMVIMALVTTFMTGPALNILNYLFPDKQEESTTVSNKVFRILISFGPAIKGKKLLRLADQLTHKKTEDADITALHLTPSADINPKEAKEYERESFRLVKHEAQNLGIKIKTLYKATNDINKEIIGEANRGKYDLMLVGSSHSVFSEDVVGGKVKNFLEDTATQVGVLVDKDFEVADRILVTLEDRNDLFLISFAERFVLNNNAKITLVDPYRLLKDNMIFTMAIEKINKESPNSVMIHDSHQLRPEFLHSFNLVLFSYAGWKNLTRKRERWLLQTPSVLILKPQR